MGNVFHCSDLGFACDFTIEGATEEEVMAGAAEHAKEEHGIESLDEETKKKIRSSIHAKGQACPHCPR